jgi:hypothetical protein
MSKKPLKLSAVKKNAKDLCSLNIRETSSKKEKTKFLKAKKKIDKTKTVDEVIHIMRPFYGKETEQFLEEGVYSW